jgi:hypothetical protein
MPLSPQGFRKRRAIFKHQARRTGPVPGCQISAQIQQRSRSPGSHHHSSMTSWTAEMRGALRAFVRWQF